MRKILLGAIAAAALSGSPLIADDESDLFAKLDANKDGSVTADEVEGDAKSKIERLLRTSDKDGDKKLSKDEFAAGLKEPETPRQPLGQGGGDRPGGGQFDPRQVFTRLDEDKDGKLSKEEARGPAQENFDRLDANSDGSIDEEEIRAMFRRGEGRPEGRPEGRRRDGDRPEGRRPAADGDDKPKDEAKGKDDKPKDEAKAKDDDKPKDKE